MSSEKKNNDYLLEVEHLKQYFPVHQFKDLCLNGHIKCRGRLVCDQNIRFTDQCHGNHHTLAHTTG